MSKETSASPSLVVAIDGPAGAGKSSVAKVLAGRLRIIYFDSGAIYRALTHIALNRSDPVTDTDSLRRYIQRKSSEIQVRYNQNGDRVVLYDNRDITRLLRRERITANINILADTDYYREIANRIIRSFAADHDVVIDGRDVGTVLFPDTPYKFYLDASVEIRAERRLQEQITIGIDKPNYRQIYADIRRRDRLDMNRHVAPLAKAPDAIYIDSSDMTVEEVTETIFQHIRRIQQETSHGS